MKNEGAVGSRRQQVKISDAAAPQQRELVSTVFVCNSARRAEAYV
jgi:hypothetical protein